jgi:hypothetical protein
MNNHPDRPATTCPACQAFAERQKKIRTRRALSHIKRLHGQGIAMLEADTLDSGRHGLWCQRVERYVRKLFAPPLDYSRAFKLPHIAVRSPLDELTDPPSEQPAKPCGADLITRQWLVPLASAMERLELRLDQEPPPDLARPHKKETPT